MFLNVLKVDDYLICSIALGQLTTKSTLTSGLNLRTCRSFCIWDLNLFDLWTWIRL